VDGAIGSIALDSVGLPVLIEEAHHHFARPSNSARAKTATAFFKISLARFSSKPSRWRRLLVTARSSSVRPLPGIALGLGCAEARQLSPIRLDNDASAD
jgi:hypothetical protein